jgi:predicted RNase H-related nuclease YkuK (DUF458 family)
LQTWKTLREEPVPNLTQFVRENTREGQDVHIGCDSLQTGLKTAFCVVVCIINKGKGGRVIYSRESVPRINSLRQRLLMEVQRSVAVGLQLSPVVKGQLTIAVDANPDVRFKSSEYVQGLVGYVLAHDFKVLVKPDSYASTTCADHAVRGKMSA